MPTSTQSTRPCPRTQMSRHDRIARIVRRAVQRCACELNAAPQPGDGARRLYR
jgi:hypothetical protein